MVENLPRKGRNGHNREWGGGRELRRRDRIEPSAERVCAAVKRKAGLFIKSRRVYFSQFGRLRSVSCWSP